MCLRDRNAEERLEANKLYPPLPGAAPAVEWLNAALCAAPPLEPAESAAPLGLGRVSAASAETDDAVGEPGAHPAEPRGAGEQEHQHHECERGGAALEDERDLRLADAGTRQAAVAHLSEGISDQLVCAGDRNS